MQAAGNATALTINPAALLYTADLQSRTYGGANPAFTAALRAWSNGDSQASTTTGTLVFSSSAASGSAAGSYAHHRVGPHLDQQQLCPGPGGVNATALTINPAVLTYTANPASRIYGAANPVMSGTVSGFINGDTQSSATSGTLAIFLAGDGSHQRGRHRHQRFRAQRLQLQYSSRPLATARRSHQSATLVYTAAVTSRPYGAANPAIGGAVTGFLNGDTSPPPPPAR